MLKLDSSNTRAWEPERDDFVKTLLDHQEHLKADRTEAHIQYELPLKLSLDLCVPIETREFPHEGTKNTKGKQASSFVPSRLRVRSLAAGVLRDRGTADNLQAFAQIQRK